MKQLILIVVLSILFSQSNAQNAIDSTSNAQNFTIIRSNIGVSGSSNAIVVGNRKYVISESIGQASVIGTYSKNGYTVIQGYQQQHFFNKKTLFNNTSLNAKVYPNPFKEHITITFNETIKTDVYISLHDISGRLLFIKKYKVDNTLNISLPTESQGMYFLNISANQKQFSTKLIKY